MLLTLIGCALVCIVLLLYLKWLSVKTFWAKNNVPHDPPHLILGSLTFLMKKNAGEWMREQYAKFNKVPYIGIWLFWRPALIINSPEIARRVLVKDSAVFRNRHLSSGKSDPVGGLNIFTVNDPVWTEVRTRITSVFTTSKLKSFQPLFLKKSKELCQRIQAEREQNKVINIRDVFTDYTTDIVGTASFGVECDGTLTGDCAMRRITRDFQKYSLLRGFSHTSIFFFPELVDIFRLRFFPKDTEEFFKKIFFTVVEQRGGFDKPVEEIRDLVDTLIKFKQNADKENKEISMDLLTAQAAIFLQGGFETSAGTLTFILYELAYSPESQDKLYQELVEINDLPNRPIFETLRKFPPMGWLDRISSEEYKIDENLTIPPGTTIYVNSIGMHMDPDYFPNPEKFIPERFLPENEKDIQPYTYLPFGDGPRVCIGRRFSEQTVRFVLAELMLKFTLRPQASMPKPNDCEFEKKSMFLLPGQFLSVDFVPRN